jgi:hypothetical protein
MFIVSGERGTGKTKVLLERVKDEGAVLVCEDPTKMRERAYRYGITDLEIICYEEFRGSSSDRLAYIHDINKYLKYLDSKVQGYSLSLD